MSLTNRSSIVIAIILTIVFLSPIWAVDRFILQDASGHVTTSYVMIEMLNGNTFFTDFYKFNSPFLPNASGHWLMVLLLHLFSGFTVTKLMATLTFAVVPASVVWLRRQTSADADWLSSFLIGSAVAFNWFWLLGTFNFLFGLAGSIFTIGLYWRWRDSMSALRCTIVIVLIAFVYFSHLIGFFIAAGAIPIIAIFGATEDRKRTVLWTLPIVFSTTIIMLIYKIEVGSAGHAYYPVWQALKGDPYSLRNWLQHFIDVDPFVLISRRTLPFTNFDSNLFAIFSPFVWICVAIAFFCIGTIAENGKKLLGTEHLPFMLLSAGALLMALLGPDDFNLMNGGLMRQRLFLAAVLFTIPLFSFNKSKLNSIAEGILAFVLLFQTVAMFEFAFRSNDETRDFMAASSVIADGQRIASAVVLEEKPRFHAFPATQMNNYLGIGRNLIVMDNYEMGHNLFPVLPRDYEDQKLILGLTSSNVLRVDGPREDFEEDLKDLDFYLSGNSGKIDIMLLYGRNEAAENVLKKNFEAQAFYQSGDVRLFRRIK